MACDGEDSWDYSPHSALLRHRQADLCLQVTRTPLKLWLVKCDQRDTTQRWHFTNFDDEGLFVKTGDTGHTEATTPRTDL